MQQHCPVCTNPVVSPSGSKESNLLIVSSVPNDEDLHYHKSFAGSMGIIFRREMYRIADIQLPECRITSYQFHDKMKDERCERLSTEMMIEEFRDKTHIVLVGAPVVAWATGLGIDDVNGLDVTSHLLTEVTPFISRKTQKVFAMVNPNSIWSRGIGELRFALSELRGWYA